MELPEHKIDIEEDKRDDNWIALQVKPVGELCNLNCIYCYNDKECSKSKIMTDEVLIAMLSKYISYSPRHLYFSWHGGEPALAGVDYFRRVTSLLNKMKKPNQEIVHAIQTNATLLNEDFVDFFVKEGFRVGVSLDGPKEVDVEHRFSSDRVSSFDRALRGINLLQDKNIPFGVICTVSKKTYLYAREILNFFVNRDILNLSFSPVAQVSNRVSEADKLTLTNEEWCMFLNDIFNEWCGLNNPNIMIREINQCAAWILKQKSYSCDADDNCAHWFSVESNGDVGSCEYLNLGISYGNIVKDSFDSILLNSQYLTFKSRQSMINQTCQQCELNNFCRNRCTRLRYKNGQFDIEGLNIYCSQRKRLYNNIKGVFESTLKKEGDELNDFS